MPNGIVAFLEPIKKFFVQIYESVFTNGYWKMYLEGIGNTLKITILALLLGVVIGVVIAVVKYINKSSGKLKFLNKICSLYITIIRGTPVMLQLIALYFIILKNLDSKILVAAIAFGINSGAYVSEIIRGGINSVDSGQSETGRSLGLSEFKTMRLIVLPQALRNILPSIFNEVIALVKETSIVYAITLVDITAAGDFVRSRNWSLAPLVVSAMIYLIIVMGLTKIQGILERRMAQGDRS